MVTVALGARPWRSLPDLRDLYLQISNRFKPAAAIAALMDMEDLGRYLSQGLEEMAHAGMDVDRLLG
jgi:hypothetical protein